jgi:hypothetical protein
MTKVKEEKEIVYDADANQEIPLEIKKNGQIYRVAHILEPLSDERFFQREREFESLSKRKNNNPLSIELQAPNHDLWNDLAVERKGYAKNPADWKEKTNPLDKAGVISALLHTQSVETDSMDTEALFDEDEGETVELRVLQSGTLLSVSHDFREPSKNELDEYTAILSNAPRKNVLASMHKLTVAERLCALYDEVCASATGYAGRVPAWHKITATQTFFLSQISRLGKSVND